MAYLPLVRRSSAPTIAGAVHPESACQVAHADGRAYLLVDALKPGLARVLVIDVADPAVPTRIGATEPLPLSARSVVADGGRLYVLACEPDPLDGQCRGSLYIYATDGAASTALLQAWQLPFGLRQPVMPDFARTDWMAASGSIVFLATGGPAPEPNVRILDTSQPGRVREVGRLDLGGHENYVTHADGYLYVTGVGMTSMTIADVRDPGRPHVVARVPVIGSANQMAPVLAAVQGSTAYAVTGVGDYGPSGVRAFDIGAPSRPRHLGDSLSRIVGPFDVAATGDRLYVIDGWRVAVYDVSQRESPVALRQQVGARGPRRGRGR